MPTKNTPADQIPIPPTEEWHPNTQDDIYTYWDKDRQVLVIEVPYDPDAPYELSNSGKSHAIANMLKFDAEVDLDGNSLEKFFISLGIYRKIGGSRRYRKQ